MPLMSARGNNFFFALQQLVRRENISETKYRIKQHLPEWLKQQLTRPRRSQPGRSCERNKIKSDSGSATGQHLQRMNKEHRKRQQAIFCPN